MERQHDLSSFGLGFIIAHVRSNRLVDFQPSYQVWRKQ
jgi:hypothetical protein